MIVIIRDVLAGNSNRKVNAHRNSRFSTNFHFGIYGCLFKHKQALNWWKYIVSSCFGLSCEFLRRFWWDFVLTIASPTTDIAPFLHFCRAKIDEIHFKRKSRIFSLIKTNSDYSTMYGYRNIEFRPTIFSWFRNALPLRFEFPAKTSLMVAVFCTTDSALFKDCIDPKHNAIRSLCD